MLPLDELTTLQRQQLDLAERWGQQATRIYGDQVILTPLQLDRLAEANARRVVTHKDYPKASDYAHMLGLFIRVFVDAFAAYLRTYKCTL